MVCTARGLLMPVWPNGTTTRPRTTSGFPNYADGTYHGGLDCAGFTYNCAPEAGVITAVAYSTIGGYYVTLLGVSGAQHYLGHFAENTILVKRGEGVTEGQRLGKQGRTGSATGVHVHWEVRAGGPGTPRVDPAAWMASKLAPAVLDDVEPLPNKGTRMKPFILIGDITKEPYVIDPYTQTRVWLSPHMLSNLRESKEPPVERVVSDDSLGSYPKQVGSRDWDGTIVTSATAYK